MELDDGTIAEFNEERNYYTDDGKLVRVITFGPVHCTVKTYALHLKVDKNDPTTLIPNPIHPHAPLRLSGG